jgi:LuxR family maltose regulon positive regulatory protein
MFLPEPDRRLKAGPPTDGRPLWGWGLDPLADARVSVPARRAAAVRKDGLISVVAARRPALVVVTAPAGYGKTTFLTEWAERDERKVAWVSLDRGDNIPEAFLGTVARAIHGLQPVDPVVFDELASPGSTLARVAPRLASTLRSCVEPFLLVVDDLHSVDDMECRDALDLIIDHIPAGSTVVASSRSEVLNLGRRRASGDLVEIGPAELAFTVAEATQLLSAAGVEPDVAAAEALVARTEGWPAGLYLAALALRDRAVPVGGLELFAGDDRFVADYLRAEVLDRAPFEVRQFMIRCSVLDELCGPLCDQTLGASGSAAMLVALARSNLFLVALDHRSEWYRFHGLFRDMLLAELRRDEPDVIPQLQANAADWYEVHDQAEAAIEHARAAGQADRAARLIAESALWAYGAGKLNTAVRWLEDVPSAEAERNPILAVLAALGAADGGRPVEADRWADWAEHRSMVGGYLAGMASFDSALAMMRTYLCAHGVAAALADAEFCVAAEPEWSTWRGGALGCLFEARMLAGDSTAEAALAEWLDTAAATASHTYARGLTERGLLAMAGGDRDSAAADVAKAESQILEAHRQEYAISALTYAASAHVAIHRRDLPAAREKLAHALRLRPLATWAYPRLAVTLRLELAKVCLALADAAGARNLLREIDQIFQHRPQLGTLHEAADRLRQQLDTIPTGTVGVSALTGAELRLLPYLQTHLSYTEIGQRLYVSTNTVKTQLRTLYRKLDVSTRHEAIERARQVGLLVR